MKFPVDFQEKAKQKTKSGGYPAQISSADLMANFHYAALDAKNTVNNTPQPFSITESIDGTNVSRVLILNPPPPLDGETYIFAFSGGAFQWIATEEC